MNERGASQGSPAVLGKHSPCLYPWRHTLSGARWGRTTLKNKVIALSLLSFRSATWHQQRDVMQQLFILALPFPLISGSTTCKPNAALLSSNSISSFHKSATSPFHLGENVYCFVVFFKRTCNARVLEGNRSHAMQLLYAHQMSDQ